MSIGIEYLSIFWETIKRNGRFDFLDQSMADKYIRHNPGVAFAKSSIFVTCTSCWLSSPYRGVSDQNRLSPIDPSFVVVSWSTWILWDMA